MKDRRRGLLFDEEQSRLLNAEHRRDGEMKAGKRGEAREREGKGRGWTRREEKGLRGKRTVVIERFAQSSMSRLKPSSASSASGVCSDSFTQIKYCLRIEESRKREREIEHVDVIVSVH